MAKHRAETNGIVDRIYSRRALVADGKNRALRTFLVNAAIDVLAALVLYLAPIVQGANAWSDFDWNVIGFMVAKTALATVFSYLLRTVIDPSRLPSPTPPGDQG